VEVKTKARSSLARKGRAGLASLSTTTLSFRFIRIRKTTTIVSSWQTRSQSVRQSQHLKNGYARIEVELTSCVRRVCAISCFCPAAFRSHSLCRASPGTLPLVAQLHPIPTSMLTFHPTPQPKSRVLSCASGSSPLPSFDRLSLDASSPLSASNPPRSRSKRSPSSPMPSSA
jgi:hypothetical protein